MIEPARPDYIFNWFQEKSLEMNMFIAQYPLSLGRRRLQDTHLNLVSDLLRSLLALGLVQKESIQSTALHEIAEQNTDSLILKSLQICSRQMCVTQNPKQ